MTTTTAPQQHRETTDDHKLKRRTTKSIHGHQTQRPYYCIITCNDLYR
jgi:hypothetical protein